MKQIPLSQGRIALVDEADFERLSVWKWCVHNCGYAVRNGRGDNIGKTILMHRVILDAPPDLEVDHINTNRLDNRRANLRLCSKMQQQGNRWKPKGAFSSCFKGVSKPADTQRWRAQIKNNRKAVHLGWFDSEREAAIAYNKAALEYFGEFARLNEIGEEA